MHGERLDCAIKKWTEISEGHEQEGRYGIKTRTHSDLVRTFKGGG
jgi:hypothetical protein